MCSVDTKPSLKAYCLTAAAAGADNTQLCATNTLKIGATALALTTTTNRCADNNTACVAEAGKFLFACKESVTDAAAAISKHIAQCYVGCKNGKNAATACGAGDVPALKWGFAAFGIQASC